jgi:hypothetical protein
VSRVVVVLEGGLVQNVYSDRSGVQVAILDNDVFGDLDPKLDLDNFIRPEFDTDLNILTEWQERKAAFLGKVDEDSREYPKWQMSERLPS